MAKKIVKKAPAKKLISLAKGKPKKGSAKKAVAKKAAVKKSAGSSAKAKLTEKELNLRQANLIENSEKKKTRAKPRVKTATKKQTNGLLDSIVDGMQEKKAKNITILDLNKIENRIADFFVICDADSTTHVNAIADSIEEIVQKQTNEKPYHTEGHQNSEWILLDYINIVVHVFMRETREYYNIEGLWGDAEIKTID